MSQSAEQLFKELQQQYYQAWFRFHPERAVEVGIDNYAGELRSYADDDIGALIALNQKLITALDESDFDALTATSQVDFKVLRSAANIELHDLEERDWRYRDPSEYVPVNAVYQLLIYPVDEVHRALKYRVQKIPEYLRGARLQLSQYPERVVPIWLEAAVSECHASVSFMRDLGRHPLMMKKFENPARLQPLFEDAAHALEKFVTFLETEIAPKAAGDFACGSLHFERLLNKKHFIETTADDVLSFGEKLFSETQQALLEQTRNMQGDENIEALLKHIQAQHPAADQLVEVYRQRMLDAYHWWADSALVTMPEKQSLKVQATPEFLRHVIPFAAYEPPQCSDPEQHGLYYVTVPAETAALAEHNYCNIDLTCVHEAFPGHHLQFVTENQSSFSYTRQLNGSASLYEGWALYCEELAIEQGFLNKDEHHFIMLQGRIWRALRIIVDVKLQTGQLSVERAIALMMAELGFTREQAQAEISWYSHSPATPLCYAVGREMILQARQVMQAQAGFKLLTFHDQLLSQGSIALPLVIQQTMGEPVWQTVREKMFS
ncbi:MAG: DUF885 domain-containing protein [Gammaproteobacteria bacterium]|nr:DUF885 domain-containing protein [Gammaproteobacteria bacterium]